MKKLLALLLSFIILLSACTPAPQVADVSSPSDLASPSDTTQKVIPGDTIIPEDFPDSDPYINMTAEEFYADYSPAVCYQDALYRSQHGFLSGSLEVPTQDFIRAENQPKDNGAYIRNSANYYVDDGNTYVVTDSEGYEVMRIFRGGGYITLEEVAAYMLAFGGSGSFPANYDSKKSAKPSNSIWGEYLRVNHSYYSNNTDNYPYEPKLPGNTQYFEMDIGTQGTVTPGYAAKIYNDGSKITRGAARLVYTRVDANGNGIIEEGEVYIFYTHNHYNDFTEYLNYYGGWGETFGNITGGGEFDSKTNCNPTPYVLSVWSEIK